MQWPTVRNALRRVALFAAQVALSAALVTLGVSQACVAELQGALPVILGTIG